MIRNPQIPKWFDMTVGGSPLVYLQKNNKEFGRCLEQVYSISRRSPPLFVLFQLSVALMQQQEQNRFYEKSISEMCDTQIKLRSRIEKLEKLLKEGCGR